MWCSSKIFFNKYILNSSHFFLYLPFLKKKFMQIDKIMKNKHCGPIITHIYLGHAYVEK